jgi:hypothetical protein
MDTSSILQGIGLFICVGAILVIVVIAFAARSLMGRRNQPTQQQQPTIWNTRGPEQPTYDDRDVQTRGGFGNAPQPRQPSQPSQGSGFGQPRVQPPPSQPSQSSGFGGPSQGTNRPNTTTPPRRADDDDIRSSGGFGSG